MRTTIAGRALVVAPVVLTTAFAAVLASTPVAAQPLMIPVNTVLGTDVFDGPRFTVPTALSGTTELSLTVTGLVYLQGPDRYGTNAAGVVVVPGTYGVGDGYINISEGGFYFGSLLIGNTTLGFRQLFATTAANGFGSAAPPTTLTLTNVPLATIFGSGLAAGTVLEFRVSDVNTFDNSGRFTLSGPSIVAAPEPSTFALLTAGLAGLGTVARRRRRASRQ